MFWLTLVGAIGAVVSLLFLGVGKDTRTFLLLLAVILTISVSVTIILIYKRAYSLSVAGTKKSQISGIQNREKLLVSLGELFGIEKELYSINTTIDEEGGSHAIIHQTIRAVLHEVDCIEYLYNVPSKKQAFTKHVAFPETEVVTPSGRKIKIELATRGTGGQIYLIVFDPPIPSGESDDFVFKRVSPPGALYLDPRSMPRDMSYDYSSVKISHPTRKLHLELIFPKNFRFDEPSAEAQYGLAHVQQRHETARLLQGNMFISTTDSHCRKLILDVDYPIIGLTYRLKWKPVGFTESRGVAS